jgi:hypothetical protein
VLIPRTKKSQSLSQSLSLSLSLLPSLSSSLLPFIFNYLPKFLYSNAVTLRAKATIYEFYRNTILSIEHSNWVIFWGKKLSEKIKTKNFGYKHQNKKTVSTNF